MDDVRFAWRALRRNPGFTAVVLLTLGLGIGANTAMFSVLDAVLLRSLPVGDSSRLAYVYVTNPRLADLPEDTIGPSSADFYDIRRDMRAFSGIAIFDQEAFTATGLGLPQRIGGSRVSGEFFSTLAVPAALGRVIGTEDDRPGHDRVAVISHALWMSAFGGRREVLDTTVTLNGRRMQIIGVAPAGFQYPRASDLTDGDADAAATDVWVPLALGAEAQRDRDLSDHIAVARLGGGATLPQAQAEMTSLMARLDQQRPPGNRGWSAHLKAFDEAALGDVRPLMWLLLGVVSFVLLIACSNAAHLLLSRSADRIHEMSVRAALGAGRGRLVRHLLAEAGLLTAGSGLLGVLIAFASVRALVSMNPGDIPRFDETSVDGRVLLYSLTLSLLTGITAGLFPAMAGSRSSPAGVLRRVPAGPHSPAARHFRRALLVGQIAIAAVLFVGAALLARSYLQLRRVNPGFSTSAITMRVALDGRFTQTSERRAVFRDLLNAVRALPGVQIAGAVDALPLSHSERMSLFELEGYPRAGAQLLNTRAASPGYFETLGTPLVEGRLPSEDDGTARPRVFVVNEAFVRTYLHGASAIGKRVRFLPAPGETAEPAGPWCAIVGVVADVRHSNLEDAAPPQLYESLWQADADRVYIAVRAARPPAEIVAAVRRTLQAIDPLLAVADVHTMDQLVSAATARRRFEGLLIVAFAALALALAAVGLYGVLAYTVRRRTAEIGIRVALGAQRRNIVGLVVVEGLGLTVVGTAIGLSGGLALARVLDSTLYGVGPADPLAYASVVIAFALAAGAACWVPARRAARVNPIAALRAQ